MLAGTASGSDMSSYNDEALKNYNDKALDACPNCGRTFLPDRLLVHLKSCNKAHGRTDQSPAAMKGSPLKGTGAGIGGGSTREAVQKPAFIKRPKTILCYIWYGIIILIDLVAVNMELLQLKFISSLACKNGILKNLRNLLNREDLCLKSHKALMMYFSF